MLQAVGVHALILGALGAPYTTSNAKWNVNQKSGTSDPTNYKGKWTGHTYAKSPADWRQIGVYELLTDRFSDGDPRNNEPGPSCTYFCGTTGGYDLRDHTMRHGGDWKGIITKLDYIKGLGFDAIWISPVFQNEWNDYHGYAQVDFTLLDWRFGTLADLRALTDAAHDRGMYIIVDIVVNHMSNRFGFVNKTTRRINTDVASPFGIHKDEYELGLRVGKLPYADFKHRNNWQSDGLYPYKNKKHKATGKNEGFPYYGWSGKAEIDDGTMGSGGYWDSDFHHNGDLSDYEQTWNNHLGKIYGVMDDLRTESPTVRKKLIAMASALLISADIDGFRLDTPMQVEVDFWKEWVPALREVAVSVGKKNFGFWGELFCTPERMGTMIGRGRAADSEGGFTSDLAIDQRRAFDGGIDYMYGIYTLGIFVFEQTKAVAAAQEAYSGVDGIHAIYEFQRNRWDFSDPTTNKNSYEQWTFCNNHDRERISQTSCGKEKMAMCEVLLMFWPGIYTHYAGDEQLYANPGTGLNGWAREELTTSVAWVPISRQHNGDDFNMASAPYVKISEQMAIRKALWPSLDCEVVVMHMTPKKTKEDPKGWGIMAFERSCPNQLRVLVVVNMDPLNKQKLDFAADKMGWQPADKIRVLIGECWTEASPNWITNDAGKDVELSSGKLQVTFRNWGYAVFSTQPTLNVDPVVAEVSPQHDSIVRLDKEAFNFTVVFDQDMKFDGSLQAEVRIHHWSPESSSITTIKLQQSGGGSGKRFTFGTPPGQTIPPGIHEVEVSNAKSAAGKAWDSKRKFISRFRVADGSASALIDPHDTYSLIDQNMIEVKLDATNIHAIGATLHHSAPGAEYLRVRNALFGEKGKWTEWKPYELTTSWPSFALKTSVIVQYYSQGSAAYFKGDCKFSKSSSCLVSWYPSMHWQGEDTLQKSPEWNVKKMHLVNDFTWEVVVDIWPSRLEAGQKREPQYKYNPAGDSSWSAGSFGVDGGGVDAFGHEGGLSAVQKWMVARGRWPSLGVGKLQNEGDSMSYGPRCQQGTNAVNAADPVQCTFRMSDLWLTYSECPATGVCYMPGSKVRAKDWIVQNDTCHETVEVSIMHSALSVKTVYMIVFGSIGVITCIIFGIIMFRKPQTTNKKYTRRSTVVASNARLLEMK